MHTLLCSNDCVRVQDVGDMHILALLQQAQVQRAAEEALHHLDESCMQDEVASEQQQELELQVRLLICIHTAQTLCSSICKQCLLSSNLHQHCLTWCSFVLLPVMHQLVLHCSCICCHWWLMSSRQVVLHMLSAA